MRTAVFLFIALITSSCATTKTDPTSPGGFIYYNIDFKKYSDQGFQITMEKPAGPYKSIGILSVELYPEVKEIPEGLFGADTDGQIKFQGKDYRVWKEYQGGQAHFYATEIIDTQSAIDELYRVAKSWGADAIVNFDISRDENLITVSGFAIDREESPK